MWGVIGSLAGAIVKFILSQISRVQAKSDRSEAEEVGAIKQREADQGATIDAQREQLDEAARSRPGDASDRLRDGSF